MVILHITNVIKMNQCGLDVNKICQYHYQGIKPQQAQSTAFRIIFPSHKRIKSGANAKQ